MSDSGQFAERAITLIEKGYRIVPVLPGQKRVVLEDWQKLKATPAMVRKWAQNGYAKGNIGILTAGTPAIDLDIYDEALASAMEDWCIKRFGDTCVRVGRAPKRLLLYITDQPFTKLAATFLDTAQRKHKVEILGDGQQFVAYGIHPDTKQPFNWTSLDEPLTLDTMELPVLDHDRALEVLAKFRELAVARGWTEVGNGALSRAPSNRDDSAMLSVKPIVKITSDELQKALKHVPNAHDHDWWIKIGMALHHQYAGDSEGLDLWHEWSMTADNYDSDECDKRWKTFSTIPEGHNPATAATILKIAHEQTRKEADEEFQRVLARVRTCNTEADLFGDIAKEACAAVQTDLQFDILCKKVQDRAMEISGVKPRIDTIRKALNKVRIHATPESEAPWWTNDWVYVQDGDRFYNTSSKTELSERAFNATFNRELLTPQDRLGGNVVPAIPASVLAVNRYQIPAVHSRVYLPGMTRIVEVEGKLFANTFDETSIPPMREPKSADDFEAIRRVEEHFKLLFPQQWERDLLLDYLAYNVQMPGEKIVWCVLIQGIDGGGKSWVMNLLSALLGPQNVAPINATALRENFTGWAQGKKLVFVDEVRLHGTNRYEIIDKLKPYISNETVSIRKMQREPYEIPNVTNYVMFTNHWDALPLNRADRRYFVLSTSFQTLEEITAFNDTHPNYFKRLYAVVHNHGDVLRYWLMTRTFSDKFNPKAPAIETDAKRKMREITEMHDDDFDAIERALDASTDPEVSEEVLNLHKLQLMLEDMAIVPPKTNAMKLVLMRMGYQYVARVRLSAKHSNTRYYTKRPSLYAEGKPADVIRAHIEQKLLPAPEDDGLGD
jgi:hypothetical protein